jgi:hypothetical protein
MRGYLDQQSQSVCALHYWKIQRGYVLQQQLQIAQLQR